MPEKDIYMAIESRLRHRPLSKGRFPRRRVSGRREFGLREGYPVIQSQREILKYSPKAAHCLPCAEAQMFQNLCHTIIFLRLNNGSSFWYHLQRVNGNVLTGYALRGGFWRQMTVRKSQIREYQ